MNAFSPECHFPNMLSSVSRALNKHGDDLLFRAGSAVRPISANPEAETGIHSAVPHRYLFAYLTAMKSFLQYHADSAVYVHDGGVPMVDRSTAPRTRRRTALPNSASALDMVGLTPWNIKASQTSVWRITAEIGAPDPCYASAHPDD